MFSSPNDLAARWSRLRGEKPALRIRDAAATLGVSEAELVASAEAHPGATLDDFDALCEHLAKLHPSRYGRMIEGVSMVHLRHVRPAGDQNVGLRLVALADRLYDSAIPVVVSGSSLPELFTEEMVNGGYRKKYLRAVSRLTALARDAATATP